MERSRTRLYLEVRTDRVDAPILEKFEEAAQALVDFGVKVKRVTGFDSATKAVVEGHVITKEVPESDQLPITVEHLEIKEVDDTDGLVVAADVLANSLNHLFRNRSDAERFTPLNVPKAVAAHPLAQHLDSFANWGGYNFTDSYYRHPEDPTVPTG
jgi:hypothetical protein